MRRRKIPRPAAVPARRLSSDDLYSHSDREQERRRREQEAAVAAAVSVVPRRASQLAEATRRRDLLLRRLQTATSSSEVAGRARVSPGSLSGLDLDDDPLLFGDIDDSFAFNDADSPPADLSSSSVVDAAQFRRRLRRPSSLVGRRPTTPSALDLGAFRRRPREPSILGSARRPLLDDVVAISGQPAGAHGTKRAADAISDSDAADSDFSSVPSPLPFGPPVCLARPVAVAGAVTPSRTPHSQVRAPPASSGSESNGGLPDIRRLAKRRRRLSCDAVPLGPSDISSPPSLTHSPNRLKGRRRHRRRVTAPSPTTAHLTTLLPQRRGRARSTDWHVDSSDRASEDSHDDEDEAAAVADCTSGEDELSYVPGRSAAAPGGRRRGRPVRRTYGSLPLSDKKPHEAVADDGKGAEELRLAASKFREVDRWPLEFEEAATETSSLSNAR